MRTDAMSKLYYNLVVGAVFLGFCLVVSHGLKEMLAPLSTLDQSISLEPRHLPEYLMRTGLRFFIAMICSVVFAIIYATAAAKNLRLRRLLIPLLDIFQSIPVLGYLSFTVTAFVALAPNSVLGVELAVIFAIFTAQVWDMIFSVYQSLITVPQDLYEAARVYKLNKWKTFWKIEMPFAIPGLIWNMILSMACSWFFVVAQEVISVGTQSYAVPGIGAYITLALKNRDLLAVFYASIAIATLIFSFNELIFKPLVVWSYRFCYEFNSASDRAKTQSWYLKCLQYSSIVGYFEKSVGFVLSWILQVRVPRVVSKNSTGLAILLEAVFWILATFVFIKTTIFLFYLCAEHLAIQDLLTSITLTVYTAIRVFFMLVVASCLWVPIGIFIGLRPHITKRVQPIIQFLTAIPANLYYPVFVITIFHFNLNPNIWLSVMMIIGAQWYILYNVIGGAQTVPAELLEAAAIFKLGARNRMLKVILPTVAPYYITGMITAAGGAWNACIISEVITWGEVTIAADGIGSYITKNTIAGDMPHVALGVMTLVIFVIIIDHILWKPLYAFASNRFRLD